MPVSDSSETDSEERVEAKSTSKPIVQIETSESAQQGTTDNTPSDAISIPDSPSPTYQEVNNLFSPSRTASALIESAEDCAVVGRIATTARKKINLAAAITQTIDKVTAPREVKALRAAPKR